VLADDVARGPLEAWLTSRRTGRPFVTWKYAATLDGRSAAADGTSRWITGEQSRADVHRLRGRSTPSSPGSARSWPTTRCSPPAPTRATSRCASSSTAARARPLTAGRCPARGPAVVAVRDDVAEATYPDQLTLPGDDEGRVDLLALLAALQQRDVVSVLLEGGPTLAGAFVQRGLVDRVVGYVAPALLGDGPTALRGAGVGTISDVHRLRLDDVTRTGDDVRLTMRRA
jgi:diaminohydroxyphosphoribosylaminopyrimidine deaminase/5-amino-6-(5-phosphoribosylamino)uracil reductase